jgi:hypothetical protein
MNGPPSNQLFGHERTVRTMQESILGSRSMPTWIFGGPFGVGKFTAARLLAGLLLDPKTRPEDVKAFRPRADTDSGALFFAGTHPDFHVVRKEQALESPDPQVRERKQRSIPVAVLRQQIIGGQVEGHAFDAPAYMKPTKGTGKVFIIDEAELIDPRGQNLLLKTLEEPPPRTWFILVTTRADRLLPTIWSRCQPALFAPLEPEAMTLWRAGLDLEVADGDLDWAVDFAEGAPGLVMASLHEGLHEWARLFSPMVEELGQGGYPTSMSEEMERCIDASAVAAEKADPLVSKQAAGRRATGLLIGLLSNLMRRRMLDSVDSDGLESERWANAIEILATSESQIEANVNRKMALAGLVASLVDELVPVGATR